jgi:hypothetical protein
MSFSSKKKTGVSFRLMVIVTRAVCNCVYGAPGASCLLAHVS